MENLFNDKRVVMTLDAGGTSFVFSALQAGKEIVEPVIRPSYATERERSLKTIIDGFEEVRNVLNDKPSAISFAFPGPADYPNGIIENVSNLPGFAGGVALGPMLEEKFKLPVFINNDGDLFAYGEAIGGLLPEINKKLREQKVPKQYTTLLGVTLGTGFGGGIVIDRQLARGDNSASGEIWITRNFEDLELTAEEGISIRAIQHEYHKKEPETGDRLSPKAIYDIARGEQQGNQEAAIQAFEKMGRILGEALANAITLIDGIMVVGGGISGAHELFMPKVMEQFNSTIANRSGQQYPRLVTKVYNLEDPKSAKAFYQFKSKEITVPFSDKKVSYVPEKKLAIGLTRLGTSEATALGAYAFALSRL